MLHECVWCVACMWQVGATSGHWEDKPGILVTDGPGKEVVTLQRSSWKQTQVWNRGCGLLLPESLPSTAPGSGTEGPSRPLPSQGVCVRSLVRWFLGALVLSTPGNRGHVAGWAGLPAQSTAAVDVAGPGLSGTQHVRIATCDSQLKAGLLMRAGPHP